MFEQYGRDTHWCKRKLAGAKRGPAAPGPVLRIIYNWHTAARDSRTCVNNVLHLTITCTPSHNHMYSLTQSHVLSLTITCTPYHNHMHSPSQSHVLPNTVTCTLPHNHIYSLTQSYVLPLTITSTVSHLLPRNHMNSLTITFTLFHNQMCSFTTPVTPLQ